MCERDWVRGEMGKGEEEESKHKIKDRIESRRRWGWE